MDNPPLYGVLIRAPHVANGFRPSGLGFTAGQNFASLVAQRGAVAAHIRRFNGHSSDTVFLHGHLLLFGRTKPVCWLLHRHTKCERSSDQLNVFGNGDRGLRLPSAAGWMLRVYFSTTAGVPFPTQFRAGGVTDGSAVFKEHSRETGNPVPFAIFTILTRARLSCQGFRSIPDPCRRCQAQKCSAVRFHLVASR